MQREGIMFPMLEKYSVGHKCKNQKLGVYVVHNDEIAEEEEMTEVEALNQAHDNEKGKVVEFVAFNTLVAFTTETQKLKGAIQGREVVVMIDCGATHNFISQHVANDLKLHCIETSSYGVIMGLGTPVKGTGMCRGVVLNLPKITTKDDFLPLELGSFDGKDDGVLGIQWLKRMRKMKVNWSVLMMSFKRDGKKIKLQGNLL